MALQAGAASCDVSPRKSLFIVFVGYPNVERNSTGVHDPLYASALCLRNEQTSTVLVGIDILYIDPQLARELRKKIAVLIGAPEEHVFISCTHTHSGPLTNPFNTLRGDPGPDPEFMEIFKAGILKAAENAAGGIWSLRRSPGPRQTAAVSAAIGMPRTARPIRRWACS